MVRSGEGAEHGLFANIRLSTGKQAGLRKTSTSMRGHHRVIPHRLPRIASCQRETGAVIFEVVVRFDETHIFSTSDGGDGARSGEWNKPLRSPPRRSLPSLNGAVVMPRKLYFSKSDTLAPLPWRKRSITSQSQFTSASTGPLSPKVSGDTDQLPHVALTGDFISTNRSSPSDVWADDD